MILKNLWIGLNSRSDMKKGCLLWFLSYWWTCLIEELYIYFLKVVSGVFIPDYK